MKLLDKLLAGRKASADSVPASRAEVAFSSIAACILEGIPKANDLESRLEMLATAVAELPGITGAIVVACSEDGRPLTYGATGKLCIRDTENPLVALSGLTAAIAARDHWLELTTEQCNLLERPEDGRLWLRRVFDEDKDVGFIIVEMKADQGMETLADFAKALPCIAWTIGDSVKLERSRRIAALRQLELTELGLLKDIDPARIATILKQIFRARAATILWQEQGRLYLSATTDEGVAQQKVVYDPGEGITGHVFETGESVLLRDATDRDEVRETLGRRVVAQYPEALAKSGRPFQFLAVPMRTARADLPHDDQTEDRESVLAPHGVIRLLREQSDPPFTLMEKEELQHFADLLALAMRAAWRWILADHILKAETEAICITRNDLKEDADERAVPRMVYCDPGAELLFGMSDKELRGKDARELYVHGEYEKIRKALKSALTQGREIYGPIKTRVKRFNRQRDEVRSVEISYRLLRSRFVIPPASYAIAIIRDTTERQHLVELLDSKGLAYFRADKEGRTLETSGAESKLTGYSVEELEGEVEGEGKMREDLYLDRGDREKLIVRVHRADGKFVYTRERLQRKDGTWFWAEGVVRLVKERDGSEAAFEGLYEDVTDRMRLQGFLDVEPGKLLKGHELYSKLEESARFQLLFMTSLSHQLRSPFGALIGHLENFSKGVTDASRFSNHLRYCIGQVRVCGQLVTNFTYMDRILKGERFTFKEINLTRLVIETKIDFESLAEEEKIKFEIHDEEIDRLLSTAWGHDGLLRQVFINLFDNAIKYSLPETIVSVRGVEGFGAKYLQISNEGFPVPREDREKIFDQGVRLPKAKAWVSDGSGLGLWLVRKILNAHGAKIRCTEVYEFKKSRTAFQIFFPSDPVRKSVDNRSSS